MIRYINISRVELHYYWRYVVGLRSGIMDYIPADIVETTAPLLIKHFGRIHRIPAIKAYYGAD